MSQFDFGTINPNTKSGTQLASDLNDFRDALNSLHSGSSRPAYAATGTLWLDATGTPWILKLFDGTDDITLGTFNASTNVFAAAGVLASSTDNALPKFNGTTGAIQNSGVIVDDNDGIRVPGNLKLSKGTDIASGTALTIPTDGNFFDVTGTTTVETIGTVAVGTRIALQFDGILTLTHSADLVLPGASDITTAAGDVATFVEYASGDWICISYSNVAAFAGALEGDLVQRGSDGSISSGTVFLPEVTAPATGAGIGALYTKDTSGQPELFYREESSGDEVQLTSGGAVVGGGGRVLLASGSVSAATTLELTTGIDSTYDAYELVLSGFRPVTDNVGLRIRVSDDGGSTFEAGASDYRYGIRFVGNTTAAGVLQSAGTTAFAVFGDTGNAVTESVNGRIVFYEPASTAFHKCFDWAGVNNGSSPETFAVFGAGQFVGNTNAIDALQIYFSSGNIAEGNYALYGMRN